MNTINDYLKLAREAKARADKATRGPWSSFQPLVTAEMPTEEYPCKTVVICLICLADEILYDNAEFIAAARSDVPVLAHAVEVLGRALKMACYNAVSWEKDFDGHTFTDGRIKHWLTEAEKELKQEVQNNG